MSKLNIYTEWLTDLQTFWFTDSVQQQKCELCCSGRESKKIKVLRILLDAFDGLQT